MSARLRRFGPFLYWWSHCLSCNGKVSTPVFKPVPSGIGEPSVTSLKNFFIPIFKNKLQSRPGRSLKLWALGLKGRLLSVLFCPKNFCPRTKNQVWPIFVPQPKISIAPFFTGVSSSGIGPFMFQWFLR